MAYLTKIGNSKGLRIPKPIIEQAHLENTELAFKVLKDGLLIMSNKKSRVNWEKQIAKAVKDSKEPLTDNNWINADLTQDSDWQW